MEWCSIEIIKSIDIGLMIDQKRLDLFQRALRGCIKKSLVELVL